MITGQALARIFVSLTNVSMQYWLAVIFLILVFMTGGSSRTDVQSLAILRPVSVIICGIALVTLRRKHLKGREWLAAGLGAIFALAAFHFVSVPNDLWTRLSSRQEIAEIDRLTGLSKLARPLSLAPTTALEALTSLYTPLAVFLLGIQLSRNELFRLLPLIIILGALSGLFGLLQVIGSNQSPLYLYEVTNGGSAVGLFANRNHAAVLLACLLPMLAVFATTASIEGQKGRLIVAGSIAILLVPLILVTGSRSGLLMAIMGLVGSAFFYRPKSSAGVSRKKVGRIKISRTPLMISVAVACLAAVTIIFSRAEAIDRLFAEGNGEDQRSFYWSTSLNLFKDYFPWGSGSGSFAEVFRANEPSALLVSTYANHVHNDWIEVALTFGLPSLLLFAAGSFLFLRSIISMVKTADSNRRFVVFGKMAAFDISMLLFASFFDYPLRTPIMMSIFALLTLWLTAGESGGGYERRKGG